MWPGRAGPIVAIDGVAEARDFPGVVAVNLSKKVGDSVTLTGSNSDCIANAVAIGRDRGEATRRALAAADHIRFTFEPKAGGR